MLAAGLQRCCTAGTLHRHLQPHPALQLCLSVVSGLGKPRGQVCSARGSRSASQLFCSAVTSTQSRQLVFLGSPEVAASVLRHLCAHSSSDPEASFKVAAVVTQPWAARGRSRKPKPSLVEEAAVACGIPEDRILRPASAKDAGFLEALAGLKPDLCVTAAYGNILPQAFLDIPTFGTLNIHPSLLPKYRGAAPFQRALQDGVEESGVSLAFTVRAMDAGPVVAQKVVNMTQYRNADEALKDLFHTGARMLIEQLPRIWSGEAAAEATPQDELQATSAPKLRKEDAVLDFTRDADALANQVRAFSSWPGSKAIFAVREADGATSAAFDLKIIHAKAWPQSSVPNAPQEPGHTIRTPSKELFIKCGAGSILQLLIVQPSSKKPMAVSAYLNGLSADAQLVWTP